MRYKYHDGGRKDAGYRGQSGDCVSRAIAIALDMPYRALRKEIDALSKEMTGGLEPTCNDGTSTPISHKFLTNRGWELTLTKGMYLKDAPRDRILIACSPRHYCAVINGTVYDSWDSRFSKRTKCGSPRLEGYYTKGEKPCKP